MKNITSLMCILLCAFSIFSASSQSISILSIDNSITSEEETQVAVLRNGSGDVGYVIFYVDRLALPDNRPFTKASFFNLSNTLVGSSVEPLGASVTTGDYDVSYDWQLVSDNNLGIAATIELSPKDAVGFYTINPTTGAFTEVLNETVAVGNSNNNGESTVGILNNGNLVFVYDTDLTESGGMLVDGEISFDIINPTTGSAVVSNQSVVSNNGVRPAVTPLDDGGFFIAWGEGTAEPFSTKGKRYDASGNLVGSEIIVFNGTSTQANTTVTKLSDNNVLVQESGKGKIYNFSGAGTPVQVGSEISIYPGDLTIERNCVTAAFDNGGFVAVFEGSDDSTFRNMGYRVFDNNGNSANSGQVDITARTLARVIDDPDVATFSNGGFVVSFGNNDFSNGGNPKIERAIVNNMHPVLDLDTDNSSGGTGKAYNATLNGQAGGVAVADSDALLTDADGEEIASISVDISNQLEGANEFLTLASATGITVSGSGTKTLTLTDAGSATKANFQAALAAIRYENTTAANTTTRSIVFTVTDDDALTSTAAASVSIAAASTSSDTPPCTDSHVGNGVDVTVTTNAGQSFQPSCTGNLNTISIVGNAATSGHTVTVYSGLGTGGTQLGQLTGQSINDEDGSISNFSTTFDFSSQNISLTAGNDYTFVISGASRFFGDSTNGYANGQIFTDNAFNATGDMHFQINIVAPPVCSAPTAQATSGVFGSETSSTLNLTSFTAPSGGADGYAIFINDTNTFTNPSDGDEPVADLTWNGSGQQPVYFGTSSSPNITISDLDPGTTYYFQIYAYNDCSGTETYETTGLGASDDTMTAVCAPSVGTTDFSTTSTGDLVTSSSSGSISGTTDCWTFGVTTVGAGKITVNTQGGPNNGGFGDRTVSLNRTSVILGGITNGLFKSSDGSEFDLNSVQLRFTGFGTPSVTITGYRDNVEVSGATLSQTLSNNVWTLYNVSTNNSFNNIDEIRITQTGSSEWVALTIDEINISAASTCSAPTAQATSGVFGSETSSTLNLTSFTAPSGGADGYAIYINDTNTFTNPSDGDEPVADLTWNGSGQQPVYFGTSSSPNITISDLDPGTTYYFQIYAYNDCSGTETYETTGLNTNDTTALGVLTITGLTGDNKVYDGTTAATATGTATLSGVASGANDVSLSGSPVFTFASANVGTGITMNTSGYTLSGTDAGKYTLTQPTLSADITAAELTIVGLTGDNKVYDGTTAATASGTATLSGIIGADDVILGGSPVFTFASANVGTGITMNTSGYTTSGTDSGNYTLTQPTLSADITAAELTIVGLTGDNKVYDGTTAATASGTATLSGIIGADDVILGGSPVFTFASANVGTGITMNTSGYTTSGTDSGNYLLTQPTLSADITAAELTIVGLTGDNKVYDGTTAATASGTATLSGIIGADDVILGGSPVFTFASANVGTGITMNTSGYTTSGTDSGNYTLTQPTLSADITAAELTIVGLTGDNKVYDGTTAATASGTATLSGIIGADDVILGGSPVFTFASSSVGTGITINTTGYTISGTDSGNYTLTQPTLSGNIIEVVPTITFTDLTRTYGDADFNLGATSNSTGTITYSIVPGGTGTASLSGTNNETVNVGNAGTVTIRASQAAAGVYAAGSKDITLTINKATLTATADNQSRTYGDSNPTLSISYSGFQNGDMASDLDTAPTGLTTAGVTTGVGTTPITVVGGSDSNYTISPVAGTMTITARPITVSADIGQAKVIGSADPASYTFMITVGNLVNGDMPTGALTRDPGEFPGTYPITLGTLSYGNNYNVTYVGRDFTIAFVLTSGIADASASTAAIVGESTSSMGIIERGVVYSSTDMTPEIGEAGVIKVVDDTLTGPFEVTISGLDPNTTYYFQSYVINSTSRNSSLVDETFYGGISSFTTAASEPVATTFTPTDGSTLVNPTDDLSIIFDQTIQKGTGSFEIRRTSDDTLVETIDVSDPEAIVAGNVLILLMKTDLPQLTDVYVLAPIGILESTGGDNWAGLFDKTQWNFQTDDTIAPMATGTSPMDDAMNVPPADDLTITFNENVVKGTGNILVKALSDDSTLATIDVQSSEVTIVDNVVTINPTADLPSETAIYIEIASGVFEDEFDNAYAGIAGNTLWNFTTADITPPTVVVSASVSSPLNFPFTTTFTFSEPVMNWDLTDVSVDNGSASIFNQLNATTFTVLITPATDGDVTINVAAGAVQDLAGLDNIASNDLVITFDGTNPTLDITTNAADPTNLSLIEATFTFSEDVTSFEASDLDLTNASISNFVMVSNTVFTGDITPLADGQVTIELAEDLIEDNAGNTNDAASYTVLYDGTNPTVNISAMAADPINVPFTATFTFSEDISGFMMSDIVLGNATASNFMMVSASEYTALITPTVDGTVTIDVAGGAAQDAATNPNDAATQLSIEYDATNPTVDITTMAADPINVPFTTTFTFSEDVTDFMMSDIVLGNATASDFMMISGSEYTALITPTADGTVTIDVAGGAAQDAATNPNEAATQLSIEYDATNPTVNITTMAADPINVPFTATFTFSEDVSGFMMSDIGLGNATASDFMMVSASEYTALITPSADGTVTIDVAVGVAQDAATNPNEAATQFSIETDATRPTVVIASSVADPTNVAFDITITFSENVLDFDLSDIDVSNGTAGSFMGSGNSYTATITPTTDGGVTVVIPENVAEDSATNGNEASNEITTEYDATNPVVEITTNAEDPTNLSSFEATFTFSESVTGFDVSDIMVTNGVLSDFDNTNAPVYTATITPDADGTVTIDIAGAAAQDAATNTNAAVQFTILSDQTRPVPVITSGVVDPTNVSFDVTITFSEDVTGFTVDDLDLGNATASNFMGSGSVYTATINPTSDGGVTVVVQENVSEDAATNGNEASNEIATNYDATNPTATLSTTAPDPVNAPFTVDIVFDEDVFGFEMADITLTNGAPSDFVTTDARTYSILITPTGAGDVVVGIPAGVTEDLATNPNNEASFTINFDDIPPVPPQVTHISDYTCDGTVTQTGDNTLEISGTAERSSTVEVFVDGISIGTVVANQDTGFWTFDYTGTTLADGTYNFTAQATDIANNTGSLSAPFTITINTVDSDGDGNPDFCDDDDNGNGNTDVEEDCDGDGIVDSQDTDNSSCRQPIQQTRSYGFSPNGDGVNDGWVIENITAFPNNVVQVFSRSGKLVFKQNNYQNDWQAVSNQLNGNTLGRRLPVGPYIYVIDFGDGSAPVRGWLYINY